ncbi:MAG: hypothetical protein ABI443_05180, partial [Chthoniobacterales bacterium]
MFWIRAVVRLNDPSTYDALTAYFIRCRDDYKSSVFEKLKGLPGFNFSKLTDTVNTVWEKTKGGHDYSVVNILPVAAEYGHRDTLEVGADLLKKSNDDYVLKRAREVFLSRTPATGDNAALIAWYETNKNQIVFDPQSKKFIVKP